MFPVFVRLLKLYESNDIIEHFASLLLFQSCFIALGFLCTGFFVNTSYSNWEEEPVITTLDSIAAPIHKIQFPTVTVCRDEYRQPNHWAFLETVLNYLAFQCGINEHLNELYHKSSLRDPIIPKCTDIQNIRKDFDFVSKTIEKEVKAWAYKKQLDEIPLLKELPFRTKKDSDEDTSFHSALEYNASMLEIADMITKNEIQLGDVRNWPHKYFAHFETVQEIMNDNTGEAEYDYYYDLFSSWGTKEHVNCSSNDCQTNLKSVQKVIRSLQSLVAIDPILSFGSFLATFTPLLRKKAQNEQYFSLDFAGTLPQYNLCPTMGDEEVFMHNLFKSMAKSLGFKDDEATSLLEIPSIMAKLSDKKFSDNKEMPTGILSAFTRCSIDDKESRGNIATCMGKWETFSENPYGNIMLFT